LQKKGAKFLDVGLIAEIHNSAKVWVSHSEYKILVKKFPGKWTLFGGTDIKVVSKEIGRCSTGD